MLVGRIEKLQPAGNRKFIFNRHQTVLVGKDDLDGDVPKREEEHGKS